MTKRWVLLIISCILWAPIFSWAQDVKDGNGKMTLPDGSAYEGQFKDGAFEGKGTLTYANGESYEGDFSGGKFDGKGILVYTDGSKYEGEFKDGLLNGEGFLTYTDGTQYKGEFKDGDFNGAVAVDSSGKLLSRKNPNDTTDNTQKSQ